MTPFLRGAHLPRERLHRDVRQRDLRCGGERSAASSMTADMRPRSVHEMGTVLHALKAATRCLEIVDRPMIGVSRVYELRAV
jgi:hypothetical protein